MKLIAALLVAACALALASTVQGTFDADYYKCYQLPYCHAQRGIKDCGWCYDAHHPNKGYGIPCKRDDYGGCQPVKPCSGEYIWGDRKLSTYGDKCTKHAVKPYDTCRDLKYCWDQAGIESCGWCYVKDHHAAGWALPCYKKDGSCKPVAYCPGEYYWKDEE
ncbi:unnamed protein product [Ostreobium quekettii]|uniref:Uncharacterized protein n=1 Tax=Ostreobium quekettii TaxID=121088 RepID=A0A8S1IMW8_9CHLO|nr:unnamed protein product [Ostreobium quekettii]